MYVVGVTLQNLPAPPLSPADQARPSLPKTIACLALSVSLLYFSLLHRFYPQEHSIHKLHNQIPVSGPASRSKTGEIVL